MNIRETVSTISMSIAEKEDGRTDRYMKLDSEACFLSLSVSIEVIINVSLP
jgi:hypothetical protein